MHKRAFILIVILLLIIGCGLFKKKEPPPPPEPTLAVLEFEAAGDINPNLEGRACPVGIRIYQLTSYTNFKEADFYSLFQKEDQVLGDNILRKEEILLKPNEKRTVFFEVAEEARTIGIFGIFRSFEKSQWKAASNIIKNKTNVINVYVSSTRLIIK